MRRTKKIFFQSTMILTFSSALLVAPISYGQESTETPQTSPINVDIKKVLDDIEKKINSGQKDSDTDFFRAYKQGDKTPDKAKQSDKAEKDDDNSTIITLTPEFLEKLKDPKQQWTFPDPKKKNPCAPSGMSNVQVAMNAKAAGETLKEVEVKLPSKRKELLDVVDKVKIEHEKLVKSKKEFTRLLKENMKLRSSVNDYEPWIQTDGHDEPMEISSREAKLRSSEIRGHTVWTYRLVPATKNRVVMALISQEMGAAILQKNNNLDSMSINHDLTVREASVIDKLEAELKALNKQAQRLAREVDKLVSARDEATTVMNKLLGGCGAKPKTKIKTVER